MRSKNRFRLVGERLTLEANLVSWDTEIFGFPVAQVDDIEVLDAENAVDGWRSFEDWLRAHRVRIVSCRLPIDRLRESMFLEGQGYRFIEVVLHPYLATLDCPWSRPDGLAILPAEKTDLPILIDIAERAFRHERYHVDPRIDPKFGRQRYGRWVRTSLDHPSQQLLKVLDGVRLIGFFITEQKDQGAIYWHLTAISPELHGLGYGRRAWQAMLRHHRDEGARSVETTISVRNIAVQGLYAQLGFRFLAPEMTFHWVRS